VPDDAKPYLNTKWLDADAPALYDWYDEYPFDLEMWRTLCRDAQGPILDLACGTGRVAVELARAGHQVVGLDVSPAMVARAKKKLEREAEDVQQRVTFRVGDMVDFTLERQSPMAIIPCLSFHEIGTAEAQESCLRSVWRHLDDGGRLVVALDSWDDTWDARGKTTPLEEPAEWGPPDMDEVNPHTGIATRMWDLCWWDLAKKTRYTRFYFEEHDGKGRTIRKFAMPPAPDWSRARFLNHDEMCAMLETCGFTVEHVYGDYDLNRLTQNSRRMTFDARKV
jgi:SAM-dependent methyltransferase